MGSRNIGMFLEPGPETLNKNNLVAPTGFDGAACWPEIDFEGVGLAA